MHLQDPSKAPNIRTDMTEFGISEFQTKQNTKKKQATLFSQLFKEKVHHRVNLHNGTNLDEFITL